MEYHNEFLNFLDCICDINTNTIPDLPALYDSCEYSILEYIKEEDTVAREDLMNSVSLSLVGMNWPTYKERGTQREIEFNQRMEYYFNTEQDEENEDVY